MALHNGLKRIQAAVVVKTLNIQAADEIARMLLGKP